MNKVIKERMEQIERTIARIKSEIIRYDITLPTYADIVCEKMETVVKLHNEYFTIKETLRRMGVEL